MSEQSFGGAWTYIKLEVIEKYLKFYTQALKNQNFKLCYVDAFAGCGNIKVKEKELDGSPLRALKYDFDSYIFMEMNEDYVKNLKQLIEGNSKQSKITIFNADCNDIIGYLKSLNSNWRGVIFLDPYAMNVEWESLKAIAQTEKFDVWYLFPISALTRVLPNNQLPEKGTCDIIDKLLGTDEWQKHLYSNAPQLNLFDEPDLERVQHSELINYVINRLKTIFPAVAPKPLILKNIKNSPLFLLCFAASNPHEKAKILSLKVANHILLNT